MYEIRLWAALCFKTYRCTCAARNIIYKLCMKICVFRLISGELALKHRFLNEIASPHTFPSISCLCCHFIDATERKSGREWEWVQRKKNPWKRNAKKWQTSLTKAKYNIHYEDDDGDDDDITFMIRWLNIDFSVSISIFLLLYSLACRLPHFFRQSMDRKLPLFCLRIAQWLCQFWYLCNGQKLAVNCYMNNGLWNSAPFSPSEKKN